MTVMELLFSFKQAGLLFVLYDTLAIGFKMSKPGRLLIRVTSG